MQSKITLILLLGLLVGKLGLAQTVVKDSSISITAIQAQAAYHIPGNDLATRFGSNAAVGGAIFHKLRNNFLISGEYVYLFGNKIKEENIFSKITNDNGDIINSNGQLALVRLFERGFTITANLGRIFPVVGPNPNSGIIFMGKIGFMQHKIRIEVEDNIVPQLDSEYRKGYDRLSNGIAFGQFLGYIHFSNNRRYNFYIGLDFTQALTRSRRDFNFDLMRKDETKRMDTLYGIKFGWFIPFYEKANINDYYSR